jgi:hypothetical protein
MDIPQFVQLISYFRGDGLDMININTCDLTINTGLVVEEYQRRAFPYRGSLSLNYFEMCGFCKWIELAQNCNLIHHADKQTKTPRNAVLRNKPSNILSNNKRSSPAHLNWRPTSRGTVYPNRTNPNNNIRPMESFLDDGCGTPREQQQENDLLLRENNAFWKYLVLCFIMSNTWIYSCWSNGDGSFPMQTPVWFNLSHITSVLVGRDTEFL